LDERTEDVIHFATKMKTNDTECIVESLFGSLHRWSKTLCENVVTTVPRGETLKQVRSFATENEILMPNPQSGMRVLIRIRSSGYSDSDTTHGAFLGDGWEKDCDFKGSQQAHTSTIDLMHGNSVARDGIRPFHDGDNAIYVTGTLLDFFWRESMSRRCDRAHADFASVPVGSSTISSQFCGTGDSDSDSDGSRAIVMVRAEASGPGEGKRWQAVKKALGPNILNANCVRGDQQTPDDYILVSVRICDVFPFSKGNGLVVSSTGAGTHSPASNSNSFSNSVSNSVSVSVSVREGNVVHSRYGYKYQCAREY
jgi:hypothetical protein